MVRCFIPKKHFCTFDNGKRSGHCDYIVVTQTNEGEVDFYSTTLDWIEEDLKGSEPYLDRNTEDGMRPLLYGINRKNLLTFIENEEDYWTCENTNSVRGDDDSFLGKMVSVIKYISRFGTIDDITDSSLISELKDLRNSLNRLFDD